MHILLALHHLPGDTGPGSSVIGGDTWLLIIAAALFVMSRFCK